jgi:hypothetical protein
VFDARQRDRLGVPAFRGSGCTTMSVNTEEISKQTKRASAKLLREKGYMSAVDVLIEIGKLSKEDYERWRFRKVPYLEQMVKINLSKINIVLKTLQKYAETENLKPSKTMYHSWGKGQKTLLRFSKSGDPHIEAAYSTHFVTRQERVQPNKKINSVT